MANVKITDLPAAQPLTGTEIVPMVQGGITVRATTAAIAASPSLTQTFLTLNQEPTLPNSRALTVGAGLGLNDAGALSTLQITLNGTSGSLEVAGNGLVVKTGGTSVTARSIQSSGAGISVSDGNGVSGNPTISLSGLTQALANYGGTGFLVAQGGGNIGGVVINGTANQIDIVDGDGVLGSPVLSISSSLIFPGTGAVTLPSGDTSQRPVGVNGMIRYNSEISAYEGYDDGSWFSFPAGAVTLINTGTGLTGGPITSSGTISIDSTVVTLNDSQVLTNKTISGSNNTLSNIANASLTNSSVTYNGVSVALGSSGTITASTTNSLTFNNGGTGEASGATFDGSAAKTISYNTVGASPLAGSSSITTVGTITSGTWNADPIAVNFGGTGLTSGTSGGVPYFSGSTSISSSNVLTANALMVGGGTGSAPSTVTTGTGVVNALGVNTGSAGAFVVNGGALGTPSSGTVTNLTGTASININGTVGATTPNTGDFTTVSASGVITSTVSTGTAPFTVASATQVANLNAATAGTATNAINTGITADSTNATYYMTFVSTTTGNLPQLVNSSITCNPSTGKITDGIAGGTF